VLPSPLPRVDPQPVAVDGVPTGLLVAVAIAAVLAAGFWLAYLRQR
jgi:hypothetical protein